MDIAIRLGLGAQQRTSKLPGFAVALTGLTDNLTHGLCALRGVPVRGEASGWGGSVPPGVSYQWHTLEGGPIAGATKAIFVPDAPLAEESVIFCVVTAPGRGSRASTQVVFRNAAPEIISALFDEVFDLDTGPQTVAAAVAFTGLNLSFAVSGAGAWIDAATGEVSIPTDVEMDGDVVVVTATNSGGTASAAFQVTIEDVAVEGAMPFGALTPAGAGGVPVNAAAIAGGDPAGHWRIASGMLVPSAAGAGALNGFYALRFDTGDTLDVMIEDAKASARVEEMTSVFAGLPTSARGLMVQNGDARTLGRIRLAPKVFDREMVLEPTNWFEDADPRQSLRPVTLGGLTIGGDPSGNRILRMENLTVQGFVCQLEQGPTETEGNNGIILVERPSRHVTIRQNEIWSRDLREIAEANDFRDNLRTSRQLRGIATKVHNGTNEHIRIEENYVHDCSRGMGMVATNSYEGVRSRLCGNIIEDCYTNFFTCGWLDGLDIFDNRCMGIYAAQADTLGAIPATSPHQSVGGSFDAGGSRSTQNITMMGNMLNVGWKRTKLHADLGLPKPIIGATGIKANDPQAPDSYYNIVMAFNTVVSHGICLAIDGGSADDNILVFNNTLASENYAGAGSGPLFYFVGTQKLRLFNNIGVDYGIGSEDGTSFFAKTLDTLEGYGNVRINAGTGDFGEADYFIGDPVKGLYQLTIDEAVTAYVPKPQTWAMTANQKKGAQGTGLYDGDGFHRAVYDKPAVTTGISYDYPLTQFAGSYLGRGAAMEGAGSAQGLTFAFQGQSSLAVDNTNAILFSMAGQQLFIRKFTGGTISIKGENNSETFIEGYASGQSIANDRGLVSYVCSIDFDKGVMLFAANGELADWYTIRALSRSALSLKRQNPRIFANESTAAGDRWQGLMGAFYLSDTFVDLETSEGLGRFFASDGRFVNFGADGSAPTGKAPLIFLSGDAPAGANLGSGGAFTLRN